MDHKIVILGGRSGTSVMARLLESAGLRLWADGISTEPPELTSVILNNLDNAGKIAMHLRKHRAEWDVMKCPEAAFILPDLNRIVGPARYIHMVRPIEERVESHINVGWHEEISERIRGNASLRHYIERVTGKEVTEDAKHNDYLYFFAQDIAIARFFRHSNAKRIMIRYDDLNNCFGNTMFMLAIFAGLDYDKNINRWAHIKREPQMGGRWK